MVWPRQKVARGENTKIDYGLDTTGEKEKRTSKKNVDGRSTSSHDNKKFRTRSMEKQRGIAFGFRKTATAVKKTGQIDVNLTLHIFRAIILYGSFETTDRCFYVSLTVHLSIILVINQLPPGWWLGVGLTTSHRKNNLSRNLTISLGRMRNKR